MGGSEGQTPYTRGRLFNLRVREIDAAVRDVESGASRRRQLFCAQIPAGYGTVTAKGVEDTSFYIYNRLVSLNDVGGDPTAFGYSVAGFHGASADRAAKWPHTMIATSTHDNKRSADVRARINVLSEMSAAWRLQLRRWSRMNRRRKRIIDDYRADTER